MINKPGFMIYCEFDVVLWRVWEKGKEMGFKWSDQCKNCILFCQ